MTHPAPPDHASVDSKELGVAGKSETPVHAEWAESTPSRNFLYRFGTGSWTQVILVSFCCFCLPGMYNAISGLGGSGQLDPTVSRTDCPL